MLALTAARNGAAAPDVDEVIDPDADDRRLLVRGRLVALCDTGREIAGEKVQTIGSSSPVTDESLRPHHRKMSPRKSP
jgi:hypothetical protein